MSRNENTARIKQVRDDIVELKKDETTKRAAADELRAKYEADGVDITSGDAFAAIDAAYKDADGSRDLLAQANDELNRLTRVSEWDGGTPAPEGAPPVIPAARGIDALLASETYEAARPLIERATGKFGTIELGEFAARDDVAAIFKAATVNATPLIPEDQRLMPPIAIPQRTPRLFDFINQSPTDGEVVEWTVETANNVDSQVAVTPYGTAANEATVTFDRRTANVRRMPVWIPATLGQLRDQPQLRNLLSTRLVAGVRRFAEGQSLVGDGTGDNWAGIATVAGTGAYAKGTADADESSADAIHRAMTVSRVALELGDDITMIGMHPNDYQEIVLDKGSDGHYTHHQGPHMAVPSTLWGYPVVQSTIFTEGTAWVGDWSRGATLFNRTGINVAASTEHADFFTRGLVAILATMEAAFAVTEPKAFAKATGI